MLRTNLSTRPFYNVRAVQVMIGALAILVLAFTTVNVVQLMRLTSSENALGAHAGQAETEAARLRGEAARIRAQIDPKELAVVAAAAREANGIIDRRAFSWTALFAEFERTLPGGVRITAVQPRLERDGTFHVAMTAEGRRVEDIDAFVEALEKDGSFHRVLPNEEQTSEEGLIEAVIDGVYQPQPRDGAVASNGEGDTAAVRSDRTGAVAAAALPAGGAR
jgi:Tfp pilus assembly protein PilN